jgi:ribosomal protein S18 acetylase RimI-like enzyme
MQTSKIKTIEKSDLVVLEPLLHTSFGEGFELQDELDYFDAMPHHSWFYLLRDKKPHGFIRCFEIEKELYQIELYVIPSETFLQNNKDLIEHFLSFHQLGNVQGRFDVNESQRDILELLIERFPQAQIKRFLHMQKLWQATPAIENDCQTDAETFFEQVASILRVLKPYTVNELKSLYAEHKLFVFCDAGVPVSALHLEPRSADRGEVITLATEFTQLRRGYAEKLLLKFVSSGHSYKQIELKVDGNNTAAVNLYRKMGFREVFAHTQQWWYVYLSK